MRDYPVKLCTKEDFQRVRGEVFYENIIRSFHEETLICVDFSDISLVGNMMQIKFVTGDLIIEKCIEDCEEDPELIE